jgi:hypothetical protein
MNVEQEPRRLSHALIAAAVHDRRKECSQAAASRILWICRRFAATIFVEKTESESP